jgi:tRNA (guanine-N7-)-methyltransferase
MTSHSRPIISKTMLRSFGRVKGRVLGEVSQKIVDENLAPLLIPEDTTNPLALFDHAPKEVVVEIGFGSGEHLAHLAKMHPEIGFIGCEPYLNGVAALLQIMKQDNIQNIRIYRGDARILLSQFPDYSISKVFVLFPDPWPKRKHHKKRLIAGDFPKLLARVIKPQGNLLLATDHQDYAAWMLSFMLREEEFIWQAKNPEDWNTPPANWIETRYQQKAKRQGREAVFFPFIRR